MKRALVDRLRALPAPARARILGGLTWRQKALLGHLWAFWLKPDDREPGAVMGTGQMPPPGPWIFWVLQGGRGSGKSTAVGSWFSDDAHRLGPAFVGAIVASTVDEARKLITDERTGFLKIAPPEHGVEFTPSVLDGLVTWKSGARAYIYSADKSAKARGGNFNRMWIDDPPKFGPNGRKFLDTLLRAFRLEGHGLRAGIATTPPDPKDPPSCPELLEWILDQQHAAQPDGTWVFSFTGASDDNLQNLDPDYQRILRLFEGTEGEDAERAGVYTKDAGSRVFRGVEFSLPPVRVTEAPEYFDAVVISIDPAESAGDFACEVGIVAAGMVRSAARAYLLEDASGRLDSDHWPAVAWDLAERWLDRAGTWRFVIEVNRGTKDSSLLRSQEVIRRLRRNPNDVAVSTCEIRPVTSRLEKDKRAEPLVTIYRAGQIGHVAGAMLKVEEQLKRLKPGGGGKLDRADAAVYALLDLFGLLDGQRATPLGGSSAGSQVGAFGPMAQSSIAVGPEPGGSPAVLSMLAPGRLAVGAFGRSAW